MSREASSATDTSTTWSLGAALGAATLASACCTIPLALVSLGVGGAWMGTLTALEPYRWLFATVAVSALGYAGYREWQISRPECKCDASLSPMARRSLLGASALAILVLLTSPWFIGSAPTPAAPQAGVAPSSPERTSAETAAAEEPETPASFRQIVLEVERMTCSSCTATVQNALEGVEGVHEATVTYEPPRAVVRFDPKTTSPEALTQATTNAGYPSQLKTSS